MERDAILLHEAQKHRQRDLAKPYADQPPSTVTEVHWLYAERATGHYPAATPRSGKWLIFVPVREIDRVWAVIKAATEAGRLGDRSKVATAKPRVTAKDPNARVICVYTYDAADEGDVQRVREVLRELGVTWRIPYKTDQDTLDGKYRVNGDTRIGKYYE
ncbi:MAG: putative phosphothreonine lyase domain-containing protein [Nitrospirota bacterium]